MITYIAMKKHHRRNKMNRTERIKDLCETALFVAIVFIGVFIIKFPGPFGYAHIGDSMIFL